MNYRAYYKILLGFADNPSRKVPIAGPILIERFNAETPPERFRIDAMALVRSIEQHPRP